MHHLKYVSYNKKSIALSNPTRRTNKLRVILRFVTISTVLLLLCSAYILHLYCKNANVYDKMHNHFKIGDIIIEGSELIPHDEIIQQANLQQFIYKKSAISIAKDIQANPQISKATVILQLPNKVIIRISEKKAAAIFRNTDDELIVIDNEGNKIRKPLKQERMHTMLLFGKNADHNLHRINKIITQLKYHHAISGLYFVNERRWNIFLHDGTIIKLPEDHSTDGTLMLNALILLEKVLVHRKDNQDKPHIYDLRLFPKKLYISINK